MTVPAQYSKLRIWRNTAVANLRTGQSLVLDPGGNVVGFEWDMDADDGFRPAGEFDLSSSTISGVNAFYQDYGTNEVDNTTGTQHMTEYKAASGALVFDTGTVDWAWGLDTDNPGPGVAVDPNMQQATVNVLADMGAQPARSSPDWPRQRVDRHHRAHVRPSPAQRPTPASLTAAPSRSAGPPPMRAAAWWPASRSPPTAAAPGIPRPSPPTGRA